MVKNEEAINYLQQAINIKEVDSLLKRTTDHAPKILWGIGYRAKRLDGIIEQRLAASPLPDKEKVRPPFPQLFKRKVGSFDKRLLITTLILDAWGIGKLFHDPPPPNTSLVLSGGGSKGSFEAGALCFLSKKWDELGLKSVCATSVGAVNALAIAESGRDGVNKLADVYLSLQNESDMYEPEPWVSEIQANLEDAGIPVSSLLELDASGTCAQLSGPNVWEIGGAGALTLLTSGFFLIQIFSSANAAREQINTILEAWCNARNIYHLGPTEQKLRDFLDFDQFSQLVIRLATVNLNDGDTYYVTEDGLLYKGHAANPEAVWDLKTSTGMGSKENALVFGAIASSAIPVIFRSQGLRQDPYRAGTFVDGGVRELLPMRAAKELGAERIIGILASIKEVKMGSDFAGAHLSSTLVRTLEIMGNEIAHNDFDPDSSFCDELERLLIYPDVEVHDSLKVDPGLIRINMAYGYMRARDLYLGHTHQLDDLNLGQIFIIWIASMVITELRMRIWELEEECLQHTGLFFFRDQKAELRELKKQVLDWVLFRWEASGKDFESLPITLCETGAANEHITDWWNKFERHSNQQLDQWLQQWDPWEPLPVGYWAVGGLLFENQTSDPPIPPRPEPPAEFAAGL